jgi:enediyne biosynthesis protein E4
LRSTLITAVLFLLLSVSCNEKPAKKTLFDLVENTGINFNNKVVDQELENSFLFRNFYNGGGAAIGDINNDGLADVMLSSNMGENKLYLNEGNWKFKDITPASGMKQDSMWSTGLVMADVNADGWLDIYVCNSGHMQNGNRRNKLYINNHNLTFSESAKQYGLDISAYTTHASFFDYDLDGDLDCFMIDNSPMPVNTLGYSNRRELPAKEWPIADFLKGGGDHLYRNDNGRFTEVTRQAGIHGTLISFGLGVSVGDINNDGYPDVYIANDSYERDYMYINQKNGTFKDELELCMQQISFSSMGADIADINNDGYPDIFTTDMLPGDDYRLKTLGAFDNIDLYRNKLQLGFYHQFMKNCLQLNNGNGTFSEIANYAGVVATDWSWGALLFDADNDGFNDIYVCNGVNKDVTNLDFMNFFANDVIQQMVLAGKKDKVDEILTHIPVNPMPNKAFRNLGNLRFADAGADWGFTQPSFSNGAAYGDLDNDGDADLIVNNENQQAFIYRNNARQLEQNHYISVLLKGNAPNTFAIGSKIKAYKSGKLFYRELFPSRGFQSSMDYKTVIGLGQVKDLDSLVVEWPDLTYTKLLGPAVDTLISLQQSPATQKIPAAVTPLPPLFDSVKTVFEKHIEDEYVDFYYERNILKMLSREGPKAAAGDVNKDGLADVFIGGTKDHPGQLYLQNAKGDFVKKDQPIFHQFMDFEDGATLFFDADNDGDLDLFIGAAGNNSPPYSRQMQNRLFKNDGQGNFSLEPTPLPANGTNIAVAAANDFDKDGDLDLFVGSRSVPRNYGAFPPSYIYVNDGHGKFTAINISDAGMVTGAVWANITGDADKELIVVGEWTSPKIFQYTGNKFTEVKTALSNLQGWWQSVAATDVNGDGKMDLILGNLGENFNLHPSKDKPVKLWMADVDHNNDTDKILTRTYDGRDVPVFLKNDLQDQIPSIKKANLKHYEFAKKSIQELFPGNALNGSVVRSVNYATSCIAINNGNGNFTIQPLPPRAQLSSMNVILCSDINKDGFPDLVTGGNSAGFLPQLEKLDASLGDVFINNGKGQFTWMSNQSSGILLTGEVKDIIQFNEGGNVRLLFLRNNDVPVMFKKK